MVYLIGNPLPRTFCSEQGEGTLLGIADSRAAAEKLMSLWHTHIALPEAVILTLPPLEEQRAQAFQEQPDTLH